MVDTPDDELDNTIELLDNIPNGNTKSNKLNDKFLKGNITCEMRIFWSFLCDQTYNP